jgi:hypothetical protein
MPATSLKNRPLQDTMKLSRLNVSRRNITLVHKMADKNEKFDPFDVPEAVEKKVPHFDANPVEDGSAMHLEIHRAVDELGKYAIELEIDPKKPIPKDRMKAFITDVMQTATHNCMTHGADLVGHVKSFLIVENHGNLMSSLVDESVPVKIKDTIDEDYIDKATFILHVIVHGIWDDRIRELTLEVLPGVFKKWDIPYKVIADYFDLQKSIAHHNVK